MQKMLGMLVIVGIAVWVFLMLTQYHPEMLGIKKPGVEDANYATRCVKYGEDVEGERAMDYRDRVKQFLSGCW